MQTLDLELLDWHNQEYHTILIKHALIRANCCKSIVCIHYMYDIFIV